MDVVTLYISFGLTYNASEFKKQDVPMVTAQVFVEGLGEITHPVALSTELLSRIKAEVLETTRQRLGCRNVEVERTLDSKE